MEKIQVTTTFEEIIEKFKELLEEIKLQLHIEE